MDIKINSNDIYQVLNSNSGEYEGCYFNKSPMRAGRKIAKKIWDKLRQNNENLNNFKIMIYNRSKDKLYSYNVTVKKVNKHKIINNTKIDIYEELILKKIDEDEFLKSNNVY